MAVPSNQIMQMLYTLAAKEQLEVYVADTAKGAVIGIACTGVGLLIGGGVGIVAGAAAGAVLGICLSNSSKHLIDVLKELTPETKEKLCAGVWKFIEEFVWFCVDTLIEKVLGDMKLKNKIMDFLRSFFERSLNMIIK